MYKKGKKKKLTINIYFKSQHTNNIFIIKKYFL